MLMCFDVLFVVARLLLIVFVFVCVLFRVCVFPFCVCRFLVVFVYTCVLFVACVFPPLFCFLFNDVAVAYLLVFVLLLVVETHLKPDVLAEDLMLLCVLMWFDVLFVVACLLLSVFGVGFVFCFAVWRG